jgi:spore coat polysaccharide biosynthesis protein SpsF
MDIAGQPMIYRVVSRAGRAKKLDSVAVATSTSAADDRLVQFCEGNGLPVFRGSEDDVLDRYYSAARHFGASVVVRLTADCPLLDPAVIDRVVAFYEDGDYDYVSNALEPTYPDGLDTEVFSMATLERVWRNANMKSEREHVTSHIYVGHPNEFRIGIVKNGEDLSAMRWTVDEPKDLALVRALYERLGTGEFGMEEVLRLLRTDRSLQDVNAGIERNEGLEKSLKNDEVVRTVQK